jgi:Ricin-type beta-trefoil lectin domain/Glycosyl hydrolase family 12/Concanavalin A-like lectin/glucanases superfamily
MPGSWGRRGRGLRRVLAGGVGPVLAAGLLAAGAPAVAQAAAARPAGKPAGARQAEGPAPLSAFQASARAKKTGQPVVASALTTATSVTVAKPGGLFTVTESLLPVRAYRSGKWQALNPDLHQTADHTVAPTATTGGLVLSGGGTSPLAVLSSHGRSMSLRWPGRLPVPALSGATATYQNVLPGVNLAVTADPQGGLSEVLVIKNATAAADPGLASLRLGASAPGLRVTADAGSLRVAASATAEPVFTAPAPQMWDSAPPAAKSVVRSQNGALVSKPSGLAAYSSQAGPGAGARVWQVPLAVSGDTITLTPPRSALTAPGTVYPLYIDPSFDSDPVGEDNSAWTEVESGFPTNSGDWDESSDLQAGLCDFSSCNGLGVARSFFRIPIPSQLTTSSSINSADVYMTDEWAPSCTAEPIRLYTTSSISSSTTWDSQPSWSPGYTSQNAAYGYDSSCPYHTNDMTWNVAGTIVGAVADHYTNQTWGLQAGDESDDLYWKQFLAGSSAITMSVSYHNPPNEPTALENAPAGACKTSQTSEDAIGADDVTLSATVGDVDNANGDDSLSTTFTVKNASSGGTLDTITVASGNAAGGLTVSATIPRATAQGWSTASASYDWYATTKDAGSPVLTSPQSETCYFLYNPQAPAAPGVSPPPSIVTIGTSFSETFSPPSGCGSTSPCPTSYTYQLGVGKPVTVVANSSPASGDWTGNITMTQLGPAQLTVYGTAAGGNPGISTSIALTGAPPSSRYPDGYFTGGTYPSLLTTGTGADPSVWLSAGSGNGTLAPAADIGSLGTLINPGHDGPGDWAGAEVLHGDFTGHEVEDVMAYYPSGTYAGDGVIIGGPGDASPLIPYSGNVWSFSDGQLNDPTYANQDNPFVLVGAGDASEQATGLGLDDLIGVLGDTSASDSGTGYELDLYSATTTGQYLWDQVLSTTAPDGSPDWNNYALATAQPGGNSGAVVLFALDKATGALYESVNPTCDTTVSTGCGQGPSSTLVGMTGTWTTISTPWGATAPDLVSADVNNAGSIELWTVSGSAATPYTLSGTTLTAENSGAPLASSDDDWQLNDGGSYAQGSSATTATDSVTGDAAAVTGSCTGSCFWADDDFFGTVANTANASGTENSYVAAPPGIIPSTATSASISVWFKTTTPDGVLVSYGASPPSASTVSSDYDPVLYVGSDGKLQADFWPVGQLSSVAPVDDGLWHHAVLTDNGSTQTLTLDGVTQGTSTGAPSFSWATRGYLDFGVGYLGGAWADEPHYQQDGATAYLTYFDGELADVTLNPPGTTAQLCSEDQTMLVDGGAYDIQNNYWSGGTTCVQTDEGDDFTVSAASIDSAGGPGAFPEIWSGCHWGDCTADDGAAGQLPIQVSDLGDATSTWTTTLPATGTYDAAYDIWFNTTPTTVGQPNGGEVMIWLGEHDTSVGSSSVAYIDGTGWYVTQTTKTAYGSTWPIVSYQRVTATTSVSNLDLRYFIRDAVVRGVVSPSSYLTSVEAGYDIEQATGSPGLTTGSFSVSPATGTPTGPIVSALSASKCIDDSGSSTSAGNNIDINDCNGADAQDWAISMDGTIQVTINGTTMCMGLSDNGTSTGTGVALENCNGSATEIWEPGEVGALWNKASGLCLADPQSDTTDGTQLIVSACDGGSEQNWTLPANTP